MADSPLTLATDGAYDLNALLIVCQAAVETAGDAGNETGRIASAVARTLRDIAVPLAGQCIDALERAEIDEQARAKQ